MFVRSPNTPMKSTQKITKKIRKQLKALVGGLLSFFQQEKTAFFQSLFSQLITECKVLHITLIKLAKCLLRESCCFKNGENFIYT